MKKNKIKKPELLIPAGDLEKLEVAFMYGADAVFIGGQKLGLRSNAKNFSLSEIEKGVQIANNYNGRIYVTTNIVPHQDEISIIDDYLFELCKIGVRGIIVADPYVILRSLQVAPEMEIHISTQTSITNLKAIEFYEKFLNAKRVVLARETTFEEIKFIKENTNVEIEIFIHGALCIAYSGRCVLSNHMTSRDSNRGGCCQSCRWDYDLILNNQHSNKLETYTMNPKDLNVVRNITRLIDLGIDCFKIEGRMKSIHYIATTTSVYRKVIDSYCSDPSKFIFSTNFIDELNKCANRKTSESFLTNDISHTSQLFNNREEKPTQKFIAVVLETKEYLDKKLIKIEQRNFFKVGEEIEIIQPHKEKILAKIEVIYDENLSIKLEKACHPQEILFLELNVNIKLKRFSLIRKL